MPTTLLFDLDGTLIDSITLIVESARHAFSSRGCPAPSDAEWVAGVGMPLRTMFEMHAPSPDRVDDLIAGYREYQLENHDRLVTPYPTVVETLSLLHSRGHPIAVVTSKVDWLALRGLEHVGLKDFVDLIVGSDATTRHKPDPAPVLHALEKLGRDPHDALFVGDSPYDIQAGNAAGVTSVAALWGPFTREQLESSEPDFWLNEMADLPALIEGLSR